ncbi:MAG: hypothetical protein ACYTGH_09365 [Planctomycetota bacterium]|jgi:hypothetical protein
MSAAGTGYQATFYPFHESPLSDSCWSLHTGADGRVYAAACIEHTGGETVSIVRYNEATDGLDTLYEFDKVTGDLRDSGRATQCKVHYSFAPSAGDGILYAASHLSGPPIGEHRYCPWNSWHDEARAFRGSYLVAYDTTQDQVLWSELMIPKEGCRCLCLDEERGRLYALTYPRDHFVIFDLRARTLRDLGRISSVNCQVLFMDRRRRVFFTDDAGSLTRYDPEMDRLETLPIRVAHAHYQNGWHGVLYDAIDSPEGDCIYLVPWMVEPRLMRYWPEDGPHGRLEDLGPLTRERKRHIPYSMSLDHVGGLVFGMDGWLYCVVADWEEDPENPHRFGYGNVSAHGVVTRIHPQTLEREVLCRLEREEGPAHYVSRGARDHAGNLYFGHVGPKRPVGLFRVTVPDAESGNHHLPLRRWG